MNDIRYIINICAHEQSGLWDIISEISQEFSIPRKDAFKKLQEEEDFINAQKDVFLLLSDGLYDDVSARVIDTKKILGINLNEAEFNSDGPFYYLSNREGI